MQVQGIVTQVEAGKDGVQVALETESDEYSVTINVLQAEIDGDLDRIRTGTEALVTGQMLDGMSPPMIVVDKVKVLE